jgi:hypothetical protein
MTLSFEKANYENKRSKEIPYTGKLIKNYWLLQNKLIMGFLIRLFLSPNETIERSGQQKEIWEEEGVIVVPSLDMFISSLGKKPELDPNIKIVVICRKGYKLEIIKRK